MPTFAVDPEKLDALVQELKSIRQRISQGPQAVMASGRRPENYDALAASVGHAGLESKLHDFYGGWSDGLGEIHDYLDEAINRLQDSAKDYRTSDANVSKAIPSTGKGS
jgi:hypothetical protein